MNDRSQENMTLRWWVPCLRKGGTDAQALLTICGYGDWLDDIKIVQVRLQLASRLQSLFEEDPQQAASVGEDLMGWLHGDPGAWTADAKHMAANLMQSDYVNALLQDIDFENSPVVDEQEVADVTEARKELSFWSALEVIASAPRIFM